MIISLHLPKTAGTSFAAILEAHFQAKLLRDYSDLPMNTPPGERCRAALQAGLQNAERGLGNIECVHGHFLPIKYLLLAQERETQFVTWMRNPVERMLSQYYFWKSHYDRETAPRLHRRVVEEDWSIERFCLGPELRNVYAQFLWAFPLEYFDFIGITESYGEDAAYFANRFLGTRIEIMALNVGDHRPERIDTSFRRTIEEFHGRDMDLYRRAVELRLLRCGA